MIDFLRCQSLEKLVIDAEIIAIARRVVRGLEIHENPIALDLVRSSGHKANYLSLPHTQRWFRKELYIPSAVIDRGSVDTWQRKGAEDAYARAAERVELLIEAAPPSPLSTELRAELRLITARSARKYGMQQLPPLPA